MNKNNKLLSTLTDLSCLESNEKIINKFISSVNLLYPGSDLKFKKSKKIEKNNIPICIAKNIYGSFSINNDFIINNSAANNSIKNTIKLLTVILENNIIKLNNKKKTVQNLPDNKKEKFFNLAIDMLCIAGFDGYFIQLNKAWTKTLGYSTDELLKKRWIDFVHEEDKKDTLKAGKNLIKGKNILNFLNRYICKDGSIKWFSWNSYPDMKSKIIYAVARDVTDLINSKEALKYSENRYKKLIETMTDGFAISDINGKLKYVNNSLCKMLKSNKKEIIGKNLINLADKKNQSILKNQIEKRKKGIIEKFEVNLKGKNKSVSVLISPQIIIGENKEHIENFAVITDITNQKKIELELENKLEFQKLISFISTKLLNLNKNNSTDILNSILSNIIQFFKFDKSAILTIDTNQYFRHIAFKSTVKNEKQPDQLNNILKWIKKRILSGKTVFYIDINKLPGEAESEKKFFNKKGFKSFFALPLKIKNKIIGMIVIVNLKTSKLNVKDIISQFKLICEIIANALIRMKIESELIESEQNYSNFIKNFQGIAFKGKLNFEPIFFHGKLKEITGHNIKEFESGKIKWNQLIMKEDSIKQKNTFKEINKTPNYSIEREYRIIRKDGEIRWVNEFIQNICDEHGKPQYIQGTIYDITEKKKAIEDLINEKNKAQNYFNIADVILIVINDKGLVTLINRKGEDILGYKKNEIIGKNWFNMCIPVQIRKQVKTVFDKLMKGIMDPVEYFENPIINKKGAKKLIAWHNSFIKNEYGKITGTLSSGEDITEKKKYEIQLKETNFKLEMALESGRTDSWEINIPDKTVTYTDRWAEYLGYKPGEIPYTQEAVASIIHEDDLEKTNLDLLNHLKGETPIYETEYRIRKKNGEYIWISSRGKIIERDHDNNPVRIIGTNFDITQLKNIENMLRESEERYRMLIENANEAITMFNTKGKIIILNSITAKFLGGKPEDFIGKTYYEILPESLISVYENTIKEIKKTKKGIVSENIIIFDNQERWFITSTQPIPDLNGNIIHFLTISLDITQRKIDEKEKEELMNKLRSKNEELKTILYVTTHDLRTPLVNIQGFSKELILGCNQIKKIIKKLDDNIKKELLKIIDEELPTDLKFITTNVEKMDKLLKGLLFLSRISNKKTNYEVIDANKLFSKIIESISYQLKEKNAIVNIGNLPKCRGHNDQLNQVFTNIIINSLKYSKNNRQLKIKITGKIKDKNSIYCIEDNGIGITPNHQDKIFKIFHRLDPNGPISGEGLGLTIVKRIIEQHNGKVWLESELNKGCIFYIQIPNKIK